jgi:NADPH:quinone reductase
MITAMRALVCHAYGDYHDVRVEEFPAPVLPPKAVRISVEYASLSFSISLWIAGRYQVKPPLPFVPGAEVVGRVLEVAPGVTVCRPGQRVFAFIGWGGYAEQAVSPQSTVYVLPEGIDSAAALHLGVSYCTAYGGLVWRAALQAEESVLVLAAAGGVGLAAVEVARALGARVIAAAGGPEKCEIARQHGAHAVIDYRSEDLRAAVRSATSNRGPDVVFDPVGGELSEAALRSLAPGGRLVTIGFASGALPKVEPNILLVKNLSIIGFNFGAYVGWSPVDERERHEPRVRRLLAELFEWHAQGRIRPLATRIEPLERFADALDALLARRTTGKVVLRTAQY